MKIVTALVALFLLSSCAPEAAPPEPAPLSFKQYQPFHINVAEAQITEEYKSLGRAPNVEHQLPLNLSDAMRIWAQDRIITDGKQGILDVIIQDASVKEIRLPVEGGVRGVFTNDQQARYDARLKVEMRIYNGVTAISAANLSVEAKRSRSIAESASPYERQKQLDELVRGVMVEINAELEKNILLYFSNYMNYQ